MVRKILNITVGFLFLLVFASMIGKSALMTQFLEQVLELQIDGSMLVLKQLVSHNEHRLDTIKRLVDRLDELSGEEIRDPNFTVHHPLNAFRFIRNHSVIYNETATKLIEEIRFYEQERTEIDKISNNLPTVQADDIEETIHSMLDFQIKYVINTKDIADGILPTSVWDKMTALECQDMMTGAYQLQEFDLAREWMEVALTRLSEGDVSTNADQILEKAVKMAAKVQTQASGRQLFCKYISNSHPLLMYRPVKLELLSRDPYIVVYHDLFGRGVLTKLIQSVTEQINTSSWKNRKEQEDIREVGNTPEREHLYKYIEALTSFKKDILKDLQISGGKYFKDVVSNCDNHVMSDSKGGASFRIYLTDIQVGGSTVFTDIGQFVTPAAGKAIFWYNKDSNNRLISHTNVVEFPAPSKDKWIATVRIQNDNGHLIDFIG